MLRARRSPFFDCNRLQKQRFKNGSGATSVRYQDLASEIEQSGPESVRSLTPRRRRSALRTVNLSWSIDWQYPMRV